jgi:hypothetical protein
LPGTVSRSVSLFVIYMHHNGQGEAFEMGEPSQASYMDRRVRKLHSTQSDHLAGDFRFFDELKRRNLHRVGILYLLACWLMLGPLVAVLRTLSGGALGAGAVVIVMLLGFPAALSLAWAYERTPEGIKPTAQVDRRTSMRRHAGARLDRAIIVVVALELAYIAVENFWIAPQLPGTGQGTGVARGSASQRASEARPGPASAQRAVEP